MSLRKSHTENGRKGSLSSYIKPSFLRSSLFGWIDLSKSKRGIAFFLLITLAGAVVFGTIVSSQLNSTQDDLNPIGGLYAWIFPPAHTPSGRNGNLKLAKEYLYAESTLFAIEDGDATSVPPADLAIWRPATGQWWTMRSGTSRQVTIQWGTPTDKPAIGDYDGDGKTDFCVFRPTEGRWYLIKSSSGDASTSVVNFGSNGDMPAPADYDGDGRTDVAVWRPASGFWFIKRSGDGGTTELPLGSNGDIPSPKDFDGDGRADLAVWRSASSTFYSINSTDGLMKFTQMGMSGAPVPADYDGDGRDDFAVREGAVWKIIQSSDGASVETNWQEDQDISVQNDYDGDGRVDIASWSPNSGKWFIKQSSNGETRIEQWGIPGDIPLPALYRR